MNLLHAGTRRNVAVAAVVSMVATVLAAVGLTRQSRGRGGRHHLPRRGRGDVQPADRAGDDPGGRPRDGRHAAVRHQEQRRRDRDGAAGRVDARGHAASPAPTPRRPSTAGSRSPTTRAATRPSPSRRRPSRRSPCSPTTAPRPTRCPRSPPPPRRSTARRTRRPSPRWRPPARYVVSYWADKSASLTTGWTLPAGQTQRSIALGTGAGRITSVASDSNAPSGVGPTTARTATGAVSTAKATMWTVVLQADQTVDAQRRAGGLLHRELPAGDLHRRRVRLDRHRAGHRRAPTPGTSATAPPAPACPPRTPTPPAVRRRSRCGHRQPGPGLGAGDPHGQPDRGDGGAVGTGQPNHNRLVPDRPRTNTPRISNGEIWDIEVVPALNRVFIAGNFTSLANTISPTTTINQAGLASYNLPDRPDRHELPPDLQRRRVRRRGEPRRHQALRRRLLQHRQRRRQAEGRQPQPHHRCAAEHLRLHQQHQQPGAVAGRDQLHALRRRPLHPDQRRSSAPASPRSTPPPASWTWPSTTSSPAASASTASSASRSSS